MTTANVTEPTTALEAAAANATGATATATATMIDRVAKASTSTGNRVCPRVCPKDWDKRKTPAASHCSAIACDGRPNAQRRGQDSNLRTPLQGHGFSKPALSATQPPLLKPFQVSGYVCFRRMAFLLE
jgi:hypothetical protein